MILSLRKRSNIRVRQPLNKIMIPILNEHNRSQLQAVENLILSEVNVKEIEYLTETAGILVKKIKPNFKLLGPRYGKLMKEIAQIVNGFRQEDIAAFEAAGSYEITAGGEKITLQADDVEITSEDIPGWLVASEGRLTVALDLNITQELKDEGIAREFVNRIQNLRKESGFEVTDKIAVEIQRHELIDSAVANAEAHSEIDVDTLFVKRIFADEGPILKRFRPRAMGRASRIRRRTSHLTVILDGK